jgi:Fic family protein
MIYNWQQTDWPNFRYELGETEADLLAFADKAGQVSGVVKGLPEGAQNEAILDAMIAEAIKTSEIEGAYVNRPDVVSSIRNQLGLNAQPEPVKDRAAGWIAELMVDVRNGWAEPLSEQKLCAWHRMLMSGTRRQAVGCWRTHEEPMQVVSGTIGSTRVHFEAPASARIPGEMAAFIRWFNASEKAIIHGPVRSAIAHLYFESIHPFEDGNGRVGRAIAEKALSQGLGRPVLLSLSRTIEPRKGAYYEALEAAQQSNEITAWVRYFVRMVLDAQTLTAEHVDFILCKTKFFDRHRESLGERPLRVIRRMLEAGPAGFEGGMNARKYVALTHVSKATATRDLQDLACQGILIPVGGGRSTHYRLRL